MNSLGDRIYELRNANGITQEELAYKIGVSRQAISKWERGYGSPDLQNINMLANVFNTTVDQLLGNSNNHFPGQRGYLKNLLYKAKTTTNSKLAKKIRNGLIIGGAIGVIGGLSMTVAGFVGFLNTGIDKMNNFYTASNFSFPIVKMLMVPGGVLIAGISSFALSGGIGLLVAGVASDYMDERENCPECGDEIDEGEKMCSNCGTEIIPNYICPSCNHENEKDDNFCRECGQSLKNPS